MNRSTLKKVAAVLNNAADHLETAFELLDQLESDPESLDTPEADAVLKAAQRIHILYEKGLAK